MVVRKTVVPEDDVFVGDVQGQYPNPVATSGMAASAINNNTSLVSGEPVPATTPPNPDYNPYRRKMSSGASRANGQEDLIDLSAPSSMSPAPQLPVDAFSQLEIDGKKSSNPWIPVPTQAETSNTFNSTTPPTTQSSSTPRSPPQRQTEKALPPAPRQVDKSETYQIKKITWFDAASPKTTRSSPILVQNANGPCPLVALVNALSLTTPADNPTPLVRELRQREQVSLEFLLSAVFDELTSESRLRADVPLPDLTELYTFLRGLDTGMNVNPRFIPTDEVVKALERTSLNHIHPDMRKDNIPGTFEHTKEMALYSAFAIPLIHGWLPSRVEAVYDSFSRQAQSYEDAQNILFREEELEDKLSSPDQEGLTEEEQQLYQDVLTIKEFLRSSATQLTDWGLQIIRKSMKPGTFAILFRNDHFSTLYRHPTTGTLMALITDAGYAGHEEVVWESLVDINGENAEILSGDFRPVGGPSHDYAQSSTPRATGKRVPGSWADIAASGGASSSSNTKNAWGSTSYGESMMTSSTEQADRDLALALQLQEEEEERARADVDRRRRESRMSGQYSEQQGRTAPGNGDHRNGRNRHNNSVTSLGSSTTSGPATGRRTASATSYSAAASGNGSNRQRPATQTVRSLLPPRTNRPADEGADDAPPSYEQAAKQAAYVPPTGHPSHPASSPSSPSSNSGLGPAATETGRRPPTGGPGALPSGRQTGLRDRVPSVPMSMPVHPAPGAEGKDRNCKVM